MKIHKGTAFAAVSALAAGSLAALALGAAPAQAATESFHLYQASYDGATGANPSDEGTHDVTLTVTPSQAEPGDPIEITVSSSKAFPNTSPAFVTLGANTSEVNAVVVYNGQEYLLRGGRNPADQAGGSGNIIDPGWTISSVPGNSSSTSQGVPSTHAGNGAALLSAPETPVALTAPAADGQYDIELKALALNMITSNGTTPALGDPLDFIVQASGGDPVGGTAGTYQTNDLSAYLNTVTLQSGGPSAEITDISAGGTAVDFGDGGMPYFRDGDVVSIAGNDQWTPNVDDFRLRMCNPDGVTGCAPAFVQIAAPVGVGLSTDGDGNLVSADYTMSTGSFTGSYAIVVEELDSGTVVNSALIQVVVLGPRSLTGPAVVSPGASNALSGANWYPNETVAISAGSDGPVNVTASGTGGFATPFTVNDTGATEFTATGINGSATSSFSMSADSCVANTGNTTGGTCDTSQTILAEVTAGDLSQAAAQTGSNPNATTIDFGTTVSSASGATLNGDLNTITVTDERGGTYGWSLTAELDGPLTSGAATIAAANVGITPACVAAEAGSATGISTGGAQDFSGQVNLCTNDGTADSAGDSSSGVYEVSAPMTLDVPAFQAAGDYTAIMTITLS